MDFIKLARRADVALGIVFLVLSVFWLAHGHYVLGVCGLVSAAASIASAKYVPARWLVKRMMLARLKMNG